ncbi:MAG: YdcF family protein [Acidimicrobiales bacterium]
MADSESPGESRGESFGDSPPESADEGVIDWLAVMGDPQVPTAFSASVGGVVSTGDGEANGPATDGKPAIVFDDDEDSIPMKRIAIIAAALVVAYFLVTFVDVWIASNSDYDGTATAAVVLGAAQYNGEPSEALQGRLDKAAALYLDDRVQLVVVTGGGQAEDITTEAKTGYDYLRDTASIPDEDLRLEVDGNSTYMSLAAASRFLADENISDVILVTDPYHAKRSQLIAEEVDLMASVSPTDSSTSIARLVRETGAVAVGRIIGFRRLDAYVDL